MYLSQSGKLEMELINCLSCNGAGQREYNIICPANGRKQYGKPCEVCNSRQQRHNYYKTSKEFCKLCQGKGKVREDIYNTLPNEIYTNLIFSVKRDSQPMTFNEAYIGHKTIFTCVDYGAAWKSSDEAIIKDVKNHKFHQASKFADDSGYLRQNVVIIVKPQGYVVKSCTISHPYR